MGPAAHSVTQPTSYRLKQFALWRHLLSKGAASPGYEPMRPLLVRMALVLMVGGGLVTLGRAASSQQFAWLEATGVTSVRLELVPLEPARSHPNGTIATFAEGSNLVRMEVVGQAAPTARLPILLFVADAAGMHRAEGSIVIEQVGRQLAGRFEASGEGRRYAGGLRIDVAPSDARGTQLAGR